MKAVLTRIVNGTRRIVAAVWRELTSLVDSPGLNRQGGTARSDHGQLSDEGWLQGSSLAPVPVGKSTTSW